MKEKLKSLKENLRIRNFLILLLSGTVNAIGVTMFLTPVGLYDSGISGTSILLAELTPPLAYIVGISGGAEHPPVLVWSEKAGSCLYHLFHLCRVCILRCRQDSGKGKSKTITY